MTDSRSDVLIVGAGSAGSILAERLSADPSCRVTMLEAGPSSTDPAVRARVEDGLVLPIEPGSPVVRRYRSLLTGHPRREADIVRGECVGGSGAVNGGYFCRSRPADFDALAVPGWSWSEVTEHYRAVENRIGVSKATELTTATATFVSAAHRAGYPWLPDLAAESPGCGIASVPLNISDGRRRGPGVVFLEPALQRPNLTVLPRTRVHRVRACGGRAVGVDAVGPDGPVHLDGDRVVLSAGAIGSAHLLMLSGIGPAADLCALGIPVVADLPVGRRCWDHPEWVMATDLAPAVGRPVLEAVLVIDDLEIRPYTVGFGGASPAIGVALMRPDSRGLVALVSADPSVPPRIEHGYDREAADVARLQYGRNLVAEMLSGVIRLDDPAWSTSQHLCGTAPMGTGENAVVDPRCRVLGVEGLWVVDGAVLATPLSRGPHATVAMAGHRAAEFVS